jgi:hypothetical protein
MLCRSAIGGVFVSIVRLALMGVPYVHVYIANIPDF